METAAPKEARVSSAPFDEAYLLCLRAGDEQTAKHFDQYFRRMLKLKLWSRLGNHNNDELIDEVMAVAMENILKGEPRSAACLAGYVRGICSNIAKKRRPVGQKLDLRFTQLVDGALTAEERLLEEERALLVKEVLLGLRSRDRHILVDLFYNEMSRAEVCEKYGVTREQLRLLLFRARARFQERWSRH